jgi:hypothetical protein
MLLDSGANVAVLNRNKVAPDWILDHMGAQPGQVMRKEHQYFSFLEATDIQVGRQWLGQVVFMTPARGSVQSSDSIQDG